MRPAAGGTAALLDELRNRSLDIAFIALSDPPPDVTAIPLGSEDLVLVAAPGQAPPGRGPVPLRALVDSTFVDFPAGWAVRTVIDRAFAVAGLDRRVRLEVADVPTVIQLLQAGLGVALLPPSLIPPASTGLRRRTVSPRVTWHVVMATPTERTLAAAQALADLVSPESSATT